MLVAIDTSTEVASLALAAGGATLAELTWRSGQNHTTQLLPNLDYLLKLVGADVTAIEAVIVAIGPGSFNGLRVGISAAKGMAFSLSVPIIGLGSLEVEAYQYAESGLPVGPIFSAGRGEVATALFRRTGGDWRRLKPDHISTVEQICLETAEKTLFCGEHASAAAAELTARLGDKAAVAAGTSDLRRAAYLAELGMKRLSAGQADDAVTLQPIYLRRPAITIAKHR